MVLIFTEMPNKDFMTFSARVQTIHRVIIPRPIRERLGIEKGDYVEVKIKKLPSKGSLPLRE